MISGANINAPKSRIPQTRQPSAKAWSLSVLIESEPRLQMVVLTRFLHANRHPLRSQTLCSGRDRKLRLGVGETRGEDDLDILALHLRVDWRRTGVLAVDE